MKKRIASLLLAVCMVVSMLPLNVFAAASETGYKFTVVSPTEGSCTVVATDRNINAEVSDGGYLTLDSSGKASAKFAVKNIAEGYRIKSVTLSEGGSAASDYTNTFINGEYGAMYRSTYDDGQTYPNYTARGHMEYSLDGSTWQWTSWGAEFGYFPFGRSVASDVDAMNDSYDLRLCITPDGKYCQGETMYSQVYHINGGASSSGSGDSGETEKKVPAVTNINTSGEKLYWNGLGDDVDVSNVDHVLLEYTQDGGATWKTYGKFGPRDSGIEYWKTIPYGGLVGEIGTWRATTVAKEGSGYENSVYTQEWGSNACVAVWDTDTAKPVSVSYVKNTDATYNITLSGLTVGDTYVLYHQTEQNFTSDKALEPMCVTATADTYTFENVVLDAESNYIVYKYLMEGSKQTVSWTYTFTDVSGWNAVEITDDSGNSGETELHKLEAPKNLQWHKFYPWGTTTSFDYNGAISWEVADTGYDQSILTRVYKDGVEIEDQEWDFTANENHTHWTIWDYSLSWVKHYGSGEYYFTVQAIGDDTTTTSSDIVTSEKWTYTMPSSKLAAPTNFVWNDTTVSWTEDVNAAGFDIDVYYSATDANATSTDNLERLGGRVWYYGESGDTNASTDFASRYMTYSGYYYVAVSSVSNDIAKNWHSDAALSSAYAYDTDSGETTTVPAVAESYYEHGLLYLHYCYADGITDDDLANVDDLRVEIYNSGDQTWYILHDDQLPSASGNGYWIAEEVVQRDIPEGKYTKVRYTTVADKGYADAVSEFDLDLTIVEGTASTEAKATFTEVDGKHQVTLSGVDGCDGFLYVYAEDKLIRRGGLYFYADSPMVMYLQNLTDGDVYHIYTYSEELSYDDNAEVDDIKGVPLDIATASVTVTDVSGWKECFPACEHVWGKGVVTAPTCVEAGFTTYTCTLCGATKTDNTVAATGEHTWDEGQTTTEPTCAESGIKTFTCTVCSGTKTEEVAATGEHKWNDWQYSPEVDGHYHWCTECGKAQETGYHSWNNGIVTEPTCGDEGFTTYTCTLCGATKTDNTVAATGEHTWGEGQITTEPTEETEGVKTYICAICGDTKTEKIGKLQEQKVTWTVEKVEWTYKYGEVTEITNTAYNNSENGGTLTYASSNEAVATVDTTGKVTIHGAGTAIISATAAAVDNKYVETSASYTLVINKAAATVTAKDHSIVYGAAPANDGYTVSGLIEGDVLSGTAAYSYNYEQYGNVGEYKITVSGLSNPNYEITFADGKLTVTKAAEYTLTLGNLNQTTGSVTGVTATVAPQDATAKVQVEYEIVTPAVACTHQHDEACGYVEGSAACTHAHDEACKYAEEKHEWTETVPTAKGTYNVRASLTESTNITVPEVVSYTTGTLEIKARASIGGGSSSASKDESLDVDSGDQSVAVDVEINKGTVEVVVTDKDLEEIVEKVPATGEVVVDLTSVEDAKELVLPADLITTLNDSEEAKQLTIVSEAAEIVMDEAVMETLANTVESGEDKISVKLNSVDPDDLNETQQAVVESIAADPVIVELNLVVTHYDENGKVTGETVLHELGGKVEVSVDYELPADMEDKHVVVAYVSDDGSVTYIRAKYVDGKVVFTTNHFSVYMITTLHAAAFEDVDLNKWYMPYVDYVAEYGLMNGTADTEFSPNETTSRAMIVTILHRLEGTPGVNYAMSFNDVEADTWYTEAVRWAAAEGIVNGYDAECFGPNDAITREQMATILYRYAQYKGYDVSVGEETNILSYVDALEIGEYAVPAMQWACGAGLINGVSEDTLQPQGNAIRAQAAAILTRFCKNFAK